jgi:Flp pilus assembly protein TadD
MTRSNHALDVLTATVLTTLMGVAGCAGIGAGRGEAAERATQSMVLRDQSGPALRLARASREAGDFASAVNLYRGVVASRPEDLMLAVEFADTLRDGGSFDEAIDVYGPLTGKSPARLGALLGLTRVYLALAEPAKAFEYVEQARAMAPTDSPVLIAHGVTLDLLGRHTEAQASYRAVLNTSPRNVSARNDLALSLGLSGQYPEAIELLTSMSKSVTATPRIRQNLALVYGLMGDDARAADFSRSDLDKTDTASNLRFFDFIRSENN